MENSILILASIDLAYVNTHHLVVLTHHLLHTIY